MHGSLGVVAANKILVNTQASLHCNVNKVVYRKHYFTTSCVIRNRIYHTSLFCCCKNNYFRTQRTYESILRKYNL